MPRCIPGTPYVLISGEAVDVAIAFAGSDAPLAASRATVSVRAPAIATTLDDASDIDVRELVRMRVVAPPNPTNDPVVLTFVLHPTRVRVTATVDPSGIYTFPARVAPTTVSHASAGGDVVTVGQYSNLG